MTHDSRTIEWNALPFEHSPVSVHFHDILIHQRALNTQNVVHAMLVSGVRPRGENPRVCSNAYLDNVPPGCVGRVR